MANEAYLVVAQNRILNCTVYTRNLCNLRNLWIEVRRLTSIMCTRYRFLNRGEPGKASAAADSSKHSVTEAEYVQYELDQGSRSFWPVI